MTRNDAPADGNSGTLGGVTTGEKLAVIVPGPFIVALVELEVLLAKGIEASPLDQLENP
jgi:hypothetical protein